MRFPLPTIMKVYNLITTISQIEDRFETIMQFLRILHILSVEEGAHALATSAYAKVEIQDDSRRVLKREKLHQRELYVRDKA